MDDTLNYIGICLVDMQYDGTAYNRIVHHSHVRMYMHIHTTFVYVFLELEGAHWVLLHMHIAGIVRIHDLSNGTVYNDMNDVTSAELYTHVPNNS